MNMSINIKLHKLFKKICIAISNNDQYIKILRQQGMVIGEECDINKTALFGSEPYLITMGNGVRVTGGACFITHDGGLWVTRRLGLTDERADKFGKIVIGDNTNIGLNSIIMPGVTIGKNCIIGCGAVVTKNIPDNSVAVGVPARVIETIEEYAEKNAKKVVLTKQMTCKREFLENYFRKQ